MFSDAELSELRGTPLYRAAGIIKGRLRELWKVSECSAQV
jgi:hypothetical protein